MKEKCVNIFFRWYNNCRVWEKNRKNQTRKKNKKRDKKKEQKHCKKGHLFTLFSLASIRRKGIKLHEHNINWKFFSSFWNQIRKEKNILDIFSKAQKNYSFISPFYSPEKFDFASVLRHDRWKKQYLIFEM